MKLTLWPLATLLLALAASGCARPLALHWYRDSAEQNAIYAQTYHLAKQELNRLLQEKKPPRPWAVILDADETVLDNSDYQWQRRHLPEPFTEASWADWVKRKQARLLPGAAAFINNAQYLGGWVVIITNRSQAQCADTLENLRTEGVAPNALICRPENASSSKQSRFDAVADGSAFGLTAPDRGFRNVQVLLYIGDNIQDFPGGSQGLRQQAEPAFADFGKRFFLLPNPMYGSWEDNPPRAAGQPARQRATGQ
mgnify:CR=1 FL=1